MTCVKRIVANLATSEIGLLQEFYTSLFGLELIMDHGWLVTLGAPESAHVQLSIAEQGGSGTPVPDLSIEVTDVDAIHRKAVAAGHAIAYALTDEPWGVRRFFLKDPGGRLINVLQHAS